MKLSGSARKFLVEKTEGRDSNWSYYRVKEMESDGLLRTFTVRNSHVVIGLAATPESNKALTRMARKIATDENTTILPVSHPDHTSESV